MGRGISEPIKIDNFQHNTANIYYLENILPGRTVQSVDIEAGEIRFTDGSLLTFIWCSQHTIRFELFEELIEKLG